MRTVDEDDVELNEMLLAMAEVADAYINVCAPENTYETSDVPPASTQAHAAANKALQEEIVDTRRCFPQFPRRPARSGRR